MARDLDLKGSDWLDLSSLSEIRGNWKGKRDEADGTRWLVL